MTKENKTYMQALLFLNFYSTTLCKLVNNEKLCSECWKLMRQLLQTYLGHTSIYCMLDTLQHAAEFPDEEVLRGCIYYLSMALWGAYRVLSLRYSVTSVLPAFHAALRYPSPLIANEVAISLHRLVSKYGKDLQLVAWDQVIIIF